MVMVVGSGGVGGGVAVVMVEVMVEVIIANSETNDNKKLMITKTFHFSFASG